MRLEYSYGVTGSALSLIKLYLSVRLQHVATGKSTSEGKCREFGVSQDLSWDDVITVWTHLQVGEKTISVAEDYTLTRFLLSVILGVTSK